MPEIEEYYKYDELPVALVIAGMREIEQHGIAGFSLRRVANACGVSCAAPYRHFKNKSGLILAIIEYVNRQWSLLELQIAEAFRGDLRRQISELCIANIRFWTANPNFRHIILMDEAGLDDRQRTEKSKFFGKTRELISELCRAEGLDGEKEKSLAFMAQSTIYGATRMLGNGELKNTPESFAMLRHCFEQIFKSE